MHRCQPLASTSAVLLEDTHTKGKKKERRGPSKFARSPWVTDVARWDAKSWGEGKEKEKKKKKKKGRAGRRAMLLSGGGHRGCPKPCTSQVRNARNILSVSNDMISKIVPSFGRDYRFHGMALAGPIQTL